MTEQTQHNGPSTPEGFVPLTEHRALQGRLNEAMYWLGTLYAMIEDTVKDVPKEAVPHA